MTTFPPADRSVTSRETSRITASQTETVCACCGGQDFASEEVLWPALIAEWEISAEERDYINEQQGTHCSNCRNNLRSQVLAIAIMRAHRYRGLLKDFVRRLTVRQLRVLEINEAGGLTPFLRRLPRHRMVSYPEIDMMDMRFPDASFDLVVHSDTLEHVPDPIRALSECRRVLRSNGICAFTVPIIVDRTTRSREGLPPSYHGNVTTSEADWRVCTEYGADAWKHVIAAGFSECRIVTLRYPAAIALVGVV